MECGTLTPMEGRCRRECKGGKGEGGREGEREGGREMQKRV